MASAYPCLSDQHDRPVVGAANFCLGDAAGAAVSAGSATTTVPGTALGTDFDRLAETAIHELGPSSSSRTNRYFAGGGLALAVAVLRITTM